MIAILRKELRDNLSWACVICAVIFLFISHAMRPAAPTFLLDLSAKCTLFLAPAMGFLLAIVQVDFETRGNNWAMLVHRPVSRMRIFIAKCAAGLLLLWTPLLLGLATAMAWAAWPGNLAMPFHGRMALPILADIFNGGCFYFTGILVRMRQARWIGSRMLPMFLPALCTAALAMLIGEFWQAVLIILAVQIVQASAAWCAFSTNGAADRAGAPRVAVGVAIFAGALTIATGIAATSQDFVHTGHWQQFLIDRDGNTVQAFWSWNSAGARSSVIADLDGNPIQKYRDVDLDTAAGQRLFVYIDSDLQDDQAVPWPINVETGSSYRSASSTVLNLRATEAPPSLARVVFDIPGRIIHVFDPMTHRLEGNIGPAGFVPAAAAATTTTTDLFPEHLLNVRAPQSAYAQPFTLAFPSAVYAVDVEGRRALKVFSAASDEDPVVSAADVWLDGKMQLFVIGTRSHLHLVQPSRKVMFSIPWNWDWRQLQYSAALLPANQHLILWSHPFSDSRLRVPQQVFEFSSDGSLVRQTELPIGPDLSGHKQVETAFFGVGYPVAFLPLIPKWILAHVIDMRAGRYPALFHACVFSSAICCAILTLLMSRGYGFSRRKTIFWTAGNLLLGPGGVAVLICLNEWPARETCPACGMRRIMARQSCDRCGAPLPPPRMDGREIFEPAGIVACAVPAG